MRVRDALDGILPLGPEMSAHIEHTCHLPGAWLDHPDTELPARAIAENKLSNQVAVKLLQELALLID